MTIGRLAPWYRWIEYAAFGGALERRRFAFLPRLADARRVLILGEGDGRTLAGLLKISPIAHFDVVELSPEMIGIAQQRSRSSERVTFHCLDARRATWPAGYFDALVTCFFLDCFTEDDASRLIQGLADVLAPGGVWLICEFAIPDDGWRRVHAQFWIWTMYRFFRATTGLSTAALPPIERLMREAGLERVEREKTRGGMMVSELWRRG
jgi:SAM-dependent methyltransferase